MPRRLPLAPALVAVLATHGLPMPSAAQAGWPNDPRINVRLSTNNNPRYNSALDTDQQGGAYVAWHDQRDFGTTG